MTPRKYQIQQKILAEYRAWCPNDPYYSVVVTDRETGDVEVGDVTLKWSDFERLLFAAGVLKP